MSSKKNAICRIVKIAVFAVVFVLLLNTLTTLADDPQTREKLIFHRIETEASPDVMLFGTSHVYCAVVPKKIAEQTGLTVWDLSSNMQTIRCTEELIKYAFGNGRIPDTVMVEVNPLRAMDAPQNTPMPLSYVVMEILGKLPKTPANLLTVLENTDGDYRTAAVFDFIRVRERMNFASISENLLARSENRYGEPIDDTDCPAELLPYLDGTFVRYITETLDPHSYEFNEQFIFEPFSADKLDAGYTAALQRIAGLCRARGVRVIFTEYPQVNGWVKAVENYGEWHAWMSAFAEAAGAEFWDFNYLTNTPFQPDTPLFYDSVHLSGEGAFAFTDTLCKLLESSDPNAYFMQSHDEWLARYPGIGGAYALKDGNRLTLIPCSDGIMSVECRATAVLFDEGGKESGTVPLSDWQPCVRSADVDVSGLPRDCVVRWEMREAGSADIEFTLNSYLPYFDK